VGKEHDMTDKQTPMRAPWGDMAPRLTEISDTLLFDDVLQRPACLHAIAA
jgi:4-carboxymuconolactone decarboxylase